MLRRTLICAGLILAFLSGATPVSAAAKHGKAATKIRVHVLTASGKAAGHARVTISRAGHAKPRIAKAAGRGGNFTTGKIPSGKYTITARKSGSRSGKSTMEVTSTGTHKITITLGKSRTTSAVHARLAHSLGTSTATKAVKSAASAERRAENKPASKEKVSAKAE
jgi:hypothetical protein